MAILLERGGYVILEDLDDRSGCSSSHVMGNFSRSLSRHSNPDKVREFYLDVRQNGNVITAYRLKRELREVVREVLP